MNTSVSLSQPQFKAIPSTIQTFPNIKTTGNITKSFPIRLNTTRPHNNIQNTPRPPNIIQNTPRLPNILQNTPRLPIITVQDINSTKQSINIRQDYIIGLIIRRTQTSLSTNSNNDVYELIGTYTNSQIATTAYTNYNPGSDNTHDWTVVTKYLKYIPNNISYKLANCQTIYEQDL